MMRNMFGINLYRPFRAFVFHNFDTGLTPCADISCPFRADGELYLSFDIHVYTKNLFIAG
jgi:hypothetical protein